MPKRKGNAQIAVTFTGDELRLIERAARKRGITVEKWILDAAYTFLSQRGNEDQKARRK